MTFRVIADLTFKLAQTTPKCLKTYVKVIFCFIFTIFSAYFTQMLSNFNKKIFKKVSKINIFRGAGLKGNEEVFHYLRRIRPSK